MKFFLFIKYLYTSVLLPSSLLCASCESQNEVSHCVEEHDLHDHEQEARPNAILIPRQVQCTQRVLTS